MYQYEDNVRIIQSYNYNVLGVENNLLQVDGNLSQVSSDISEISFNETKLLKNIEIKNLSNDNGISVKFNISYICQNDGNDRINTSIDSLVVSSEDTLSNFDTSDESFLALCNSSLQYNETASINDNDDNDHLQSNPSRALQFPL